MKAKLYKTEKENYVLVDSTKGTYDDGYMLGTSRESQYNKLSIKNCQAIERGYDLDELADFYSTMTVFIKKDEVPTEKQIEDAEYISEIVFKAGFQKALEVNNTKLYTLEDMMNCWNKALTFQDHKETLGEYIQSLKQTEWDCIIEMENSFESFRDGTINELNIPKLDENGCLILKLKSE